MKKVFRYLFVLFILFAVLLPVFAADNEKEENDETIVNSVLASSNPFYMAGVSARDYLVSSGDIYTLTYYAGNTSVKYVIVVDPTYKIRVANLGVIDAAGKTFLELKTDVENIVSANYPMSGVQLIFTQPATFKITVRGEVQETVELPVTGMVRLSEIVSNNTSAVVTTDYASKRFATVTDYEGNQTRYDLFQTRRFADMSQDPYLRPDDTVTLEKIDRKVSIEGAVQRPGEYELEEGENLKALVEYYGGGLDVMADTDKIAVSRTIGSEAFYLDSTDLSEDFELMDRDAVTIGNLSDLKNTIFIQGAVKIDITQALNGNTPTNNIQYKFNEGETYIHFVHLNRDLFTDVSDYQGSYVSRGEEKINLNLYSMLFDPEFTSDLKLEANDILVVPFRQFFVTVSGAVKTPGRFAYVPDRTYEYYVGLAGGFDADLNNNDAMKIMTKDGGTLTKDQYITPETTIDALKNSFSYKFNKVVTPLMTVLSLVTSTIVIVQYFSK